MGIVNINQDKHLTAWRFSDKRVYDLQSACMWIAKIIEIPSIATKYISLRDLTNRSDEGNTSTQIFRSASSSEIYRKAIKANADIISLTGRYQGELIVIGVDLSTTFTISETIL